MRGAAAILAAGLLAFPAAAQDDDGVTVDGLLPDAAFFAAATCGVPPGQDCPAAPARWQPGVVTIALLPSDHPLPVGLKASVTLAMQLAVDQINQAGSGITLQIVPPPDAEIRLRFSTIPEGAMVPEVPDVSGPGEMGVGYMTLWWDDDRRITQASILISATILPEDIRSVVLEEIFQALGPLFDIQSLAYEGVSILSQTSNQTVTIAGQDARLLQWLYPPP